MHSIFDYLYWRGDLGFDESPLNEVDSLILARFSYMPMEMIGLQNLSKEKVVSLKEIASLIISKMKEIPEEKRVFLNKQDIHLLEALSSSERFSSLGVFAFRYELDDETQTQFCAVSLKLGSKTGPDIFVAFRGTDNTLIGWKEDCNMGFICPVPAQVLAAEYLDEIASCSSFMGTSGYEMSCATPCINKSFINKPCINKPNIIVAGHSKGGNLAVYAASFCSSAAQKRIVHVYNFDGPGFDAKVLSRPEYQRICERTTTFVPQSSVVGMLLGHEEPYIVIHSEQSGLMQHDLYSWCIERMGFECLEKVTDGSRFVDATLKSWIAGMDYSQREGLVDAAYEVLSKTNARTLRDLGSNWLSNSVAIMSSIGALDESSRAVALQALKALVKCAGATMALKTRHNDTPHSETCPNEACPNETSPNEACFNEVDCSVCMETCK